MIHADDADLALINVILIDTRILRMTRMTRIIFFLISWFQSAQIIWNTDLTDDADDTDLINYY